LNIAPDFLELYQLQQLLVHHHPDSEITLTNHNSGILLARLQKDELDLCLAFGPVPPQLPHLPICQVAMVLMVPASLGDGPVDLNEQCWIVNTDDCPFKEPLEQFWRSRTIVARATILAQDLSRKELVAQGLGIGFLEPQDGLSLISKGSGRRFGTYTLEVPLSIVYRDATLQTDAELLRQYIRNRYDTLPAVPSHIPTTTELQN
jgi:DNA-binding transcriptional LysR family regulator